MTTDARRAVEALNAADATPTRLGIRVLEVETGAVDLELTVEPAMTNGAGVAHGGWLFLLADTAFGYAATTVLPGALTTEADIRFHRPALAGGVLRASARVVTQTRSTVLVDVAVTTGDGKRVASFRGGGRAPRPAGASA